MREKIHVKRTVRVALATGLLLMTLPLGATRAGSVEDLPLCGSGPGRVALPAPAPLPAPAGSPDWLGLLDEEGTLVGHELRIGIASNPILVNAGARAFVTEIRGGRLVLGERVEGRTRLSVVDAARACRFWSGTLGREAYDVRMDMLGRSLEFVTVEPADRTFSGAWRLSLDSPGEVEHVDEPCLAACEPGDEAFDPAMLVTLSDPRPVPFYSGARWSANRPLTFRWHTSETPPTWSRAAVRVAADGASTSRGSRAPTYAYDSSASDTIRYTTAFPTNCRYGIACASRSLPDWWTVRLRPQGTDFSWGTLRWCQKSDGSGCFDVERTMLHELGHVSGLGHPESSGFQLAAAQTVMHSVIPARPKAGSGMRTFGPCDVATLQMGYGVPSAVTPISVCLDLVTQLTLKASSDSVPKGSDLKLRARLGIDDQSAYGLLAGDPLRKRSVELRYRAAGSGDAWTSVWMTDGKNPGVYVATLYPQRDLEFRAVFKSPSDEGLRTSRSEIVRVVVTAPCGTTCPSSTEDLDW